MYARNRDTDTIGGCMYYLSVTGGQKRVKWLGYTWNTEWYTVDSRYLELIDWLCWGLTTRQPLWVILCRLPEKGREEIVEEMKETIREETGTGMKVKKQKK